MSLQRLDLTTALRPELLPDETVLFITDGIGLYEGKYKLPEQQDGSAYLTSHRICYVDSANPRQYSVALQLKDVERYEFYAGFLKSSAKVTIFPKYKRGPLQTPVHRLQDGSPFRSNASSPAPGNGAHFDKPSLPPRASTVNWVCPICSYSNPLPVGFDPVTVTSQTPIPPCQTCGIKPELKVLTKAAIAAARASPMPADNTHSAAPNLQPVASRSRGPIECPKCTFNNHPSLSSCEMCGSTLPSSTPQPSLLPSSYDRADSPGPFLDAPDKIVDDQTEPHSIKLSFRSGGEKVFYERLKGAMTQKKWLLASAPLAPTPQSLMVGGDSPSRSGAATPEVRGVGIAGLERRGLEKREQTGSMLNTAFADLESLMASAKEIIALAETMSNKSNESAADVILREQANALEMKMSRDQFGSGSSAEMGYLKQLARVLADYLTNDAIGALRKSGGIMNLVDLYADWSRSNEGKDSASPDDFGKAARLWETLGLPIRLRTFKNGVIVVQSRDRTDEKTVEQFLDWMKDFKEVPPDDDVPWDWRELGRGVSVADVADRFGWTVGVAIEELEMAEDRGVLVREESIEGLRFWENAFPAFEETDLRSIERGAHGITIQ